MRFQHMFIVDIYVITISIIDKYFNFYVKYCFLKVYPSSKMQINKVKSFVDTNRLFTLDR